MNSSNVALINQTNDGAVSPDMLEQYAAALQQQVDNHLAPAWNVRANISVLSGIPKVLFVTRWQPGAGPGRGGVEHLAG